MSKQKKVEEKYKSKTPREHVLDRPGNYIGQMEKTEDTSEFVPFDNKMVLKSISYSPAFIKIFDEILTNAIDHSIREKTVSKIKIETDPADGRISVYNDGPGIEVEIHPEAKVYVPEFIFTQVYTSSNYNDEEERDWAGRNGIGAKASSIFSKKFVIETVDSKNKLYYYQECYDNISKIEKPVIKKSEKPSYTKITFYPDFERFYMNKLDNDSLLMIEKRVYEASAILNSNVKLYFNNNLINIKNLISYAKMFDVDLIDTQILDKKGDWELAVAISNDQQFHHCSFINGIPTSLGGKHVEYITNQIVKKTKESLKNKHKDIDFSPSNIKNSLFLFIRGKVANPTFNSQTKDYLTTASSKFSSSVSVSDKLIAKIIKSVGDKLAEMEKIKSLSKFNKEVSTRSVRSLRIPKLEDAHWAGTKKSKLCSLILTEGDSAKTAVISGISARDREYVGIFPLKGKGLNVQKATKNQLENNEEIKNIMKILGLQKGFKYENLDTLRYGKVYLCSDQDFDGFHCKSLIVNFFRSWFPELLKLEYVKSIKTPLVKVFNKKNKKEYISFYNLQDFEEWRVNPTFEFEAKYKKGLGSLTKEDAKECFQDLEKSQLSYTFDENALDSIDVPFAKLNQRKEWLSIYDQNDVLDYTLKEVSLTDFINKELKHFSVYDNLRSIPHIIDGLKPSQRKILYACFKRKLTNSIRVSQLAGYVSEQAEYHHGEASLNEAIINMAQDYVGSNNLNLLFPEDQFGTRISLGNDHASPRYIHTCLSSYTTLIFNPQDFPLLECMKGDEGDSIEPKFYYPIIPMILVNGSKGIGSGYSTDIPCYNPKEIIEFLKNLLHKKKNSKKLIPWFRGFKGTVEISSNKNSFITKGTYEQKDKNKITITELPIKKSTEKYIETLNVLEDAGLISNYKNKSSEKDIQFELTFKDPLKLKKLIESGCIYDQLDLTTKFPLTNMNLFVPNQEGKDEIKIFQTPEQILKFYYEMRLDMYSQRKNYQLEKMEKELSVLFNKIRFINSYLKGEITIDRNTEEKQVIQKLTEMKFDKYENSYNYLLDIPLRSLSKTKLEALESKYEKQNKEYKELKNTEPSSIWLKELDKLSSII